MAANNFTIKAGLLDGQGGVTLLDWHTLTDQSTDQGLLWVHLNYASEQGQSWLYQHSGLDEVIIEALLAEETRPRVTPIGSGLLMALRGVNLSPGADPEDMISVRIWLDRNRIISAGKRPLLALKELDAALANKVGPATAGEFLIEINHRLLERVGEVIDDIEDHVDEMEEEVLTAESHELRARLADIRRQIISLRRYLAPQREALNRLQGEKVDWLSEQDRMRLREVSDRLTRQVEDLDAARDRAGVTHEEIANRLSEQANRRMYVLSIVAAVFLPLSFFTGLLGINVGGIPGSDSPIAFTIICILLAALVGIEVWIFKRQKWL
ncbi:MAG: zinc transporter ZntB [Desulfobulbaceae bacterium]|nr:zinc transporter ZntB [Desulfobulbaceae bacterium]